MTSSTSFIIIGNEFGPTLVLKNGIEKMLVNVAYLTPSQTVNFLSVTSNDFDSKLF